jgi:hypothetical protein
MIKYEPVAVSDDMNLTGKTVRVKKKDKTWIFGAVDGESPNKLYFFNCSIQGIGVVNSKAAGTIVRKDDIDTIEIEREA